MVHGEVTSYKLDEQEHEKVRKQTPLHYIELKEKGLSDREIAADMEIPTTELYQLKSRWGFDEQDVKVLKRKLKNAKRFRGDSFNNVKPEERTKPKAKEEPVETKPKKEANKNATKKKAVEEAKRLLAETKLSVTEISKQTGLATSTLYKHQKKIRGASYQKKKSTKETKPKHPEPKLTQETKTKIGEAVDKAKKESEESIETIQNISESDQHPLNVTLHDFTLPKHTCPIDNFVSMTTEEHQQLQDNVTNSETQIQKLKNQVELSESKIDTLTQSNIDLHKEKERLKRRNQDLEQQLNRYKHELKRAQGLDRENDLLKQLLIIEWEAELNGQSITRSLHTAN